MGSGVGVPDPKGFCSLGSGKEGGLLGFRIKGNLKGTPWKGAPYLKKLGRLREVEGVLIYGSPLFGVS